MSGIFANSIATLQVLLVSCINRSPVKHGVHPSHASSGVKNGEGVSPSQPTRGSEKAPYKLAPQFQA